MALSRNYWGRYNLHMLEEPQKQCYYLQIYDSESGELLLDLDSQGEFAVDWSPDGTQLLTSGENGAVRIWDAYTGEVLLKLVGHQNNGGGIFPNQSDRVLAARFSPNGKQAASFSAGGMVHIWDTTTGELIDILEHPQAILADTFMLPGQYKIGLAWSPLGDRLVTGWHDGLARIWDLGTREIDRLLAGHTSNAIGVDWSPDGSLLAVSYSDGKIKIWDTVSWTIRKIFDAHEISVFELNWSPDGRRIVSGDNNSIIFVWEVETGDIVAAWDMQAVLGGFQGVKWNPDGDTIAILGMSNPMPIFRRVWQSTEDLIEYAYECCVWRELSTEERIQFGLPVKEQIITP
jgi:WD40 repeat protein